MSDTDGTPPVEIDVNTDNLDDFAELITGNAVPKAEEVVDPDVADDVATEDEPEQTETPDADEVSEEEAEPEADEDEDPAADEDDKIDLKKHKNRKTAQERISELTAERRTAERRAEELERRLAALEAGQKKDEPETLPRRVTVDPDAPHPMDVDKNGDLIYPLGEFDPVYVADYTRFTIRKESAAIREEEQKEAAQRVQQEAEAKLQTEWTSKLDKAAEEYDDLRPSIATLEAEFSDLEPSYGIYLAQTIMSMDRGPEVLYYLSHNPQEARKIAAAGPVGATLALGRIEDRIERSLKAPAKAAVRVSKAPEPAVATRGVGSRNGVSADTDNLDDFEKLLFSRK